MPRGPFSNVHLGAFLQLAPTASLGLIQDPNEKRPDGSYELDKPPSVEAQRAMRVVEAAPHVFELKGTKRFKPGDPLIDFLGCMRAGFLPASTHASARAGDDIGKKIGKCIKQSKLCRRRSGTEPGSWSASAGVGR